MKKTFVIAMALAMMLSVAALAETAAESSAESMAETQTEETSAEMKEEKNGFLDWIGQGMDKVSGTLSEGLEMAGDAVEAGWNRASGAVVSGVDWLGGKVSDWTSEAEAYIQKKQWDKKVQDAWETLKHGAQQAGETAEETLTEAYHTVRDWLVQTDETVDQTAAEALDRVAGAAGVAEAKLSSWYRKIETCMTEKADLVTESTREAWDLIKCNAVEAGSIAGEKLEGAYTTLRDWLTSIGEPDDSEMMQVLKDMEGKEPGSETK